jgi:hypothetical protein
MPIYEELTDSEKNQIKINAKRNLEYAMYGFEIEILIENAKSNPSQERIESLQSQIAENEIQIKALGNVL